MSIDAYLKQLSTLSPGELQQVNQLFQNIRKTELAQRLRGSLYAFMQHFWSVLEPEAPFVGGWPLISMCLHLEAVTDGRIKRILINVPPGSCKSLACNVFWPAWVWARGGELSSKRFLSFSYSIDLTRRDNGGVEGRFSRLINSEEYKDLFGKVYNIIKDNETKISNNKTGWKIASSIGGVGTGERADVIILDDPHNVKEGESEAVRTMTVEWFANTMSNRLNSLDDSAIVIIMQRVHAADVSGYILERELDYEHLCIPAYSDGRRCETCIGWIDPREEEGINYWPERFSDEALARMRATMLEFAWAGQYQQIPAPRGGGLIKYEWWQPWNAETAKEWDVTYPSYPKFDLIISGVDTAYTENEANDPSAQTVWGVISRPGYKTGIFLLDAWQGHLAFHDLQLRVAETCSRWRVDRLLVEGTAAGKPIIGELRRTYGHARWGISNAPRTQFDENGNEIPWERDKYDKQGNPVSLEWKATPWSVIEVPAFGKGKLAKSVPAATAIVGMFYDGLVWAPQVRDRGTQEWNWTQRAWLLLDQAAYFPHAAHDDLLDTMVMCMRYLRETGFAEMAREAAHAYKIETLWSSRNNPPPIYPGASH